MPIAASLAVDAGHFAAGFFASAAEEMRQKMMIETIIHSKRRLRQSRK
jgi:hypothetical protein